MKRIAVGLALAVLMSGCATKAYVNEQIAAVNGRMDGKSGELSGRIDQNSSRLNQQQAALDGVSRTAQEALDRANAAGKLAEGKFMYEMSLSSQIAFKVDSSVLTPAAKEALDAFVPNSNPTTRMFTLKSRAIPTVPAPRRAT